MLQIPVFDVKSHPAALKVTIVFIALSGSAVPAAEVACPEVVVSQKLLETWVVLLSWKPTRPPTSKEPETLPVL